MFNVFAYQHLFVYKKSSGVNQSVLFCTREELKGSLTSAKSDRGSTCICILLHEVQLFIIIVPFSPIIKVHN